MSECHVGTSKVPRKVDMLNCHHPLPLTSPSPNRLYALVFPAIDPKMGRKMHGDSNEPHHGILKPLYSQTVVTRFGMLSTSLFSMLIGIASHEFCMASQRFYSETGVEGILLILYLTIAHMFSMGLRSGDEAG